MSGLKELQAEWEQGYYGDCDMDLICLDHAKALQPHIEREELIWNLLNDCIDSIRDGGEIPTPRKIELFSRAIELGYIQ